MVRKILSVFLVILLCCCVVFQCSLNANAVFGVDDALLIAGLTCELLGAGITIYSVSQFVQSPTFNDFANSVVDHVDRELSLVKLNGQLFFDMTKVGWMKLTNWVKSNFNGTNQDIDYLYVTGSEHPISITCSDGTVLPYQGFMEFPFFIYNSVDTPGKKWVYWVQQKNAGMIVNAHSIYIYCAPKSQVNSGYFQNGVYTDNGKYNSMQDGFFKGERGGFQQLTFNNSMHPDRDTWYEYRTIDILSNADSGALNPNFTTQEIPTEQGTASVRMHSDSKKYPGAIDSPATDIGNNESVLVKVPDNLIVDDGTGNPTITTNSEVISNTLADLTVDDVQPKIKTETVAEGAETVVGNVVADTANPSLSGNASSDIETANKFRLPKSFLEGFPFSIPYSMFVGIKSLVADPHAPVYDIPFKIARLNIYENIHIDLNQFNPLAKLCRALLSIVWVAGLAMTCNKFIKR